jgi:RNA-directed DNA polymerase
MRVVYSRNIAKMLNPIVRGWFNYFSAFYKSKMAYNMMCLNARLYKWVRRKYSKLNATKALKWLKAEAKRNPRLFAHWEKGWLP